MRFFHYLSLFVVFAFSACEKEVNVKIPEHQPKLVLNSVLAPDIEIKANVARTRKSIGVLDTASFNLENARVLLFENNVLLDTFKFVVKIDTVWVDPINNIYDIRYQSGYYPSKTFTIQPEKTYKMTADVTGYPSVSAETTIPSVPTVTDIQFIPNVFKRGDVFLSNLSFKIPNLSAGNKKYYIRVATDFTTLSVPDTMKGQALYIAEESTDVLSGNVNPVLKDEYGIASEEIKNNTVNIFTSIGYAELGDINFHKLYIYVYSVDLAYDKYVQKYLLQDGEINFSLTPPTPIIMYSNVTNGYGILGGYSVGTAIKQL